MADGPIGIHDYSLGNMEMIRHILSLCLLGTLGCSGPQSPQNPKSYTPDPYATPPSVQGTPVTGDAVPFTDEEPTRLPQPDGAACVPYDQAKPYVDYQDAHHRWLKRQAAAQKGWKRLEEAATMSLELGRDGTPNVYGMEIVEIWDDRFVDKNGDHWLFVGTPSPCHSYNVDFYIDSKDQVFSVDADVTCAKTKLTSCGAWPGEGCGRKPSNTLRYYVRVPKAARLLETGATVKVESGSCIEFEPELGIAHPP